VTTDQVSYYSAVSAQPQIFFSLIIIFFFDITFYLFYSILKLEKMSQDILDNETRPKHPGGRPVDPVWDHFERTSLVSAGHFSAKCKFCGFFAARGRPNELQIHLAKDCRQCPDDLKLKYMEIIVVNNKDQDTELSKGNKRSRTGQTTLDDHWDNDVELSKSRQKLINQAWTKAFISCGIPFSVIENPFFVNAIKSLRSSYNPPSRETLSGNLLNHEVIRINSKVKNILSNVNNLTLGKY
jgi:hypothetical protein